MNNASRSNGRSKGPKKSKSQKKAQGGVNLRQATSSLLIPSSARSQMGSGFSGMTTAPNSMAAQQRQRGPRSTTRSDGKSIVIKRRELIGSIAGSIAFSVRKYAVNPGIAATFPLLSIQAPQWEQYRFRKLAFEYITRCATTTVGSVILAPDYDSEDSSPTTEAQISGYEGAVEDAPWKNITCFIDCSSVTPGPRKFIRTSAVPGDVKNYDALNLFLATVEEIDASSIGKLWVDYEVELSVPQNSPSDEIYPKRTSVFTAGAGQVFTTGINAALDFSNATAGYDPLGIGNDVAGAFTPPKGVYQLEYGASFTDTAVERFTVNLSVFKNDVAILPSVINRETTAAANDWISVSGSSIVACNGFDLIEVEVNLTGAAGVLNSVANTAFVYWSLA